jgi:hypothetical protein
MQKRIIDFPLVNNPLGSDAFLADHSGTTSRVSLSSVVSYANSYITPSINITNTSLLVLSGQNLNEHATFGADINSLNSQVGSLTDGISNLQNNVDSINSDLTNLNDSISALSLQTESLSSTTGGLIFSFNLLDNKSTNLNAYVAELSSWVNSLDLNSNTNPFVLALSANVESLSAGQINLTDFTSSIQNDLQSLQTQVNLLDLNYPNNSYILSLSSYCLSLSADVQINSSNIQLLSAASSDVQLLSSSVELLKTSLSLSNTNIGELSSNFIGLSSLSNEISSALFALDETGLITSNISFSANQVIGKNGIILSPDKNSNNLWSFNSDGELGLPGPLVFKTFIDSGGGSRELPELLDISKSVLVLGTGFYILPEGKEGQIIYFVPRTNVKGDFATQIYIANARFWYMLNGQKTSAEGPMFWVPWDLVLDYLDPYDGILPSVVTAIFTEGAWNLSQGGRADGYYQIGSNIRG